MKYQNYIHIIDELRSLPKHGLPDNEPNPNVNDPSDEGRKARAFSTELNDLYQGILKNNKIMDDFNNVIQSFSTNTLDAAAGISKLNSVLKGYGTALMKSVKANTFLEQRNKQLNKTLGISSEVSAELGEKLDAAAREMNTGGEYTRKYAQTLNKILPMQQRNIKYTDKQGESMLVVQRGLQTQLGLTEEAAQGYELYAATFKNSQDEGHKSSESVLATQGAIAKQIQDTTKLTGVFKTITSDIASLSANIQLQYSRIPGALELAVVKAKVLGATMGDLHQIGNQLLNIETSIGSEMEYQLLSGKRLVDKQGNSLTQQYRMATIKGDANAQADALNKILETQGDTLKDNLFAREQLAETLGIEESKVSRMVQQRELLNKLGPDAQKVLDLKITSFDEAVTQFGDDLSKEEQEDLQTLLDTMDTRTTDQRIEELLANMYTEGIIVQSERAGTTQKKIITGARTQLEGKVFDEFTNMVDVFQKVNPSTFGKLENFATLMASGGLRTELQKVIDIIPIIGTKFTAVLNKVANTVLTGWMAWPGSGPKPDNNEDAIVQVNDAVLFNPRDKFKILASTSEGQLNQAANTMTGGGGASAAEIAVAVATALKGVNLYVSPNEVQASIAFNDYHINK